MLAVRRLIAQRHLAAVLCAAVLLLKLLVPTGYMTASEHGRVSLVACSGMAKPSAHGRTPSHGKSEDHGATEVPCAFAGLSAAALDASEPLQLAALAGFIVAVGFVWPTPPALPASAPLRPPLRGPPPSL